jgi:hypothetical protein
MLRRMRTKETQFARATSGTSKEMKRPKDWAVAIARRSSERNVMKTWRERDAVRWSAVAQRQSMGDDAHGEAAGRMGGCVEGRASAVGGEKARCRWRKRSAFATRLASARSPTEK